MGTLFAAALFTAAVFGFFWVGQLAAVGAGWQPASPLLTFLLAAG